MITVNGVRVAVRRSARLGTGQVVAIPEDTRARLRVQVGGTMLIGGLAHRVERAFIEEVRAADNDNIPQDAVIFMRTIPRGVSVDQSVPQSRRTGTATGTPGTSRRVQGQSERTQPQPAAPAAPPRTRTPRQAPVATARLAASQVRATAAPARPVTPPEPEPEMIEPVGPAIEIQPLPRLEISGFNLVPCIGYSMSTDDRTTVRVPSAARALLGVNRGDVLTIGAQRFTVRSATHADMDRYPTVAQSELLFFHSSVNAFPLVSAEEAAAPGATAAAAPASAPEPVITDPEEVNRQVQARLRTALNEQVDDLNGVMNDVRVESQIQDGSVNLTIDYLPGARGISGAPDNIDAALTGAAEQLAEQTRGIVARSQRLLNALGQL